MKIIISWAPLILLKLMEAGRISGSNVPKSCLPEILNLKTLGFINWEKSGRGGVYTIEDREAINTLLENTGYHGSTKALTPKAKAVAFHTDAHKGKDDDTLLLMLSVTREVFWANTGYLLIFSRSFRTAALPLFS
jgi:hypothetical protein